MKEHLINEKIIFYLPFLLVFTINLDIFSTQFNINGGEYEFMFYEVVILTFITSIVVLLLYFLLSKLIKNKRIIFILLVIFAFVIRNINIISILLFILLLIVSIIYKKENFNLFIISEIFSSVIALTILFLAITTTISSIYKGIVFTSRISHYDNIKKISLNKEKKSPNIYWFHMDGMPNTNFINNYYKEPLNDFKHSIKKMNIINNENASFVGGHHTITALPSLINPDYYDNYLKEYLNENDKCTLERCKTQDVPTFKDLNYRRIDSELLKGFKKKGYTTIGILEYNQYTSLKTDYVYDIYDNKKCEIGYFKGHTNNDDIYKDILKIHFNYILEYKNIHIMKNHIPSKYISCEKEYLNYPNISKVNQLKETLTAIKDSNKKDNNPKFYFIDNTLMHRYWNYDKNGKFIKEENVNLADYDDCYLFTTKAILEFINYINDNDPNSIIIFQGDHGIHALDTIVLKKAFNVNEKEALKIRNSTISLISIPEEYKNGDEKYLDNPLNISRYLINNYVGNNYEYIK